MSDTHRAFGFIDVLTARAARTIGIDFQIFRANFNFFVVDDFGHYFDRRERRVSARLRIERGNSDKAVYAFFGFQISVRIVAFRRERHAFYARFVAF